MRQVLRNNNPDIAILMATYNGAIYIREQIDSLFSQTYSNWHLYVHDDGSTDNTIQIIMEYYTKHPEKITLMDYTPQGGACKNFLSMLERVDSSYYMFCDQDDVWLPEKIELSLKEIRKREQESPGIGIVVCSDLFVVDEDMKVINDSMWDYLCIYPQYIKTFRDSGASAIATGCTMLFNQKAKAACLPYSPCIMMHDCWVCLCTLKQQGKLYGISRQLVRYRQHDNNTLGVGASASQINILYRIRNFLILYKYNVAYYKMLYSLGYGSIIKYILSKIHYRMRIKRGYY